MAWGVKDLISLLEQVPLWKRLSGMPARLEELERRVAALEERPKLPICEKCGIGYMRLDRTEEMGGPFAVLGDSGAHIKIYKCDRCGNEDRVSV